MHESSAVRIFVCRVSVCSIVANVAARRPEGRDRGPLPEEHAHVDLLGELGEERPHDERLLLAAQRQLRREEPAGQVDVRCRGGHVGRHPRQRLRAVDQHLERVARREVAPSPARTRGSRRRAHAPSRRAAAGAGGGPRSSGRCRGRATWPSLTVASSRNRGGRSWPATESAGPDERPLAGASSPGGRSLTGTA